MGQRVRGMWRLQVRLVRALKFPGTFDAISQEKVLCPSRMQAA